MIRHRCRLWIGAAPSEKFIVREDRPDDRPHARAYVKLLAERFPHVQSVALQLLERDPEFRELGEEYEACIESVARLERPGGDEALLREYRALCLRLEGELLRYISEYGGSGGRR
jgi:hypothetical protein